MKRAGLSEKEMNPPMNERMRMKKNANKLGSHVIDAQIMKVRNDGAGKNFVVYADGSERQVPSWKEACEALKRGEIQRNLLGIKI
jgi:hypothetical protein